MGSKVLEMDPSIIENKLRIKEIDQVEDDFNKLFNSIKPPIGNRVGDEETDQVEEEFNKLFNNIKPPIEKGVGDGIPWKLVTPIPGLCVKFFTMEGDKNFVNVCHTREIPPPKDISDNELIALLESETPSNYRVPMSISDGHTETDKAGNLTIAYDVAVNTSLLHKIENNKLFQVFFMTILMEALQEKYKIQINMSLQSPYVILKNRKVLGTLRPHRIQQRDIRPPPSPLIEEISSPVPSSGNSKGRDSKLKLERHPAEGEPEYLLARVRVKAFSEQDILLDVGEDRLVLTAAKKQQSFLDIFLPFNIDQEKTTAEYSRADQELKIRMPVLK